jgi:hypothetical protein
VCGPKASARLEKLLVANLQSHSRPAESETLGWSQVL